MKAFISTIPFGEIDPLPIELLRSHGIDFRINPYGRKITTTELASEIKDSDILIAGTEVIDISVLDRAPKLKLIARVGIGLDGVELNEARSRNISVTYTPEAPAPAVAELTLALIFDQLRGISRASQNLKKGSWVRYQGRRISEIKVGVIGAGRIGGRVMRRLSALGTPQIFANDLVPDDKVAPNTKIRWATKHQILRECDVITLHLPLSQTTKNMISHEEFAIMKDNAIIINTSRGGIIDEQALSYWLQKNEKASAAIDTFVDEPYSGDLISLENCTLTCHMGSMTQDCRARMEIEATKEAINLVTGRKFSKLVPDSEYQLQTC